MVLKAYLRIGILKLFKGAHLYLTGKYLKLSTFFIEGGLLWYPIDQKLIDRINVLAKKKKEGTITSEELKEQEKLRKEYIRLFREGFKSQLKTIKVVDEKGNDITPEKLKREKLKN